MFAKHVDISFTEYYLTETFGKTKRLKTKFTNLTEPPGTNNPSQPHNKAYRTCLYTCCRKHKDCIK